jgi:predicted nucleotidyltransferase
MVMVFGSVAGDEETAKSDIDLLVIGEIGEDALYGFLSKAEQDIHRPLNYVLIRPAEFRERLWRDEPFTRRIMAEPKIILKVNPDDYRWGKAGSSLG